MPFRAFPFPIHRGRTVDSNGQCSPSAHLSSHLSSSILTKVYNWTHGLTHMCCTDLNKWGTSLLDEFGRSVTSAASPIGGSKQHKAAQQVSDSRITAHQLSLWGRNMAEWRKDTFFLHVCIMSHIIYCLMRLACFPIRVVWRKSHYQVCLMQLPEELTKMTTSLSDCRLQTLWLCRCALMECIWQQLAVRRWPSSQALRSATSYLVPHSAP